MSGIKYTEEFRSMIAEFLKYQLSRWKSVQVLWLVAYGLFGIVDILAGDGPFASYLVIIIGQACTLYYLYNIWQWHRRYAQGKFFTEIAEITIFCNFAINGKAKELVWLETEIMRMLNDFSE